MKPAICSCTATFSTLELRSGTRTLFDDDLDEGQQKILCRTDSATGSRYDGRWWEYQANKVIGPLLLPRPLVDQTVDSLLVSDGHLGIKMLGPDQREEAVQVLAKTFDVNPAVARIRLDGLHPSQAGAWQLTLKVLDRLSSISAYRR